jgi:two-component sensor histidine kinase
MIPVTRPDGGDRVSARSGNVQTGSIQVTHDARGARLARQRLISDLAGLVSAAVLNDAAVVAGELLGNAVRHARALPGGVMRVTWRVEGGRSGSASVRLSVIDGGAGQGPTPRPAGPDSVDGRGLAIVSALARAWGVRQTGDGQCVWAEIGAAPGAGRGVAP